MNDFHRDGDVRIWWATPSDKPFVLHLLRKFRAHEFFWVPDYAMEREILARNILCFDYRVLEAGYIWVTIPPNGRARINQLAVDEQLWRNKVGTQVVSFFEGYLRRNGAWSIYLSCNSRTPGHCFWPQTGFTAVVQKRAGYRGGENLIWAKLLDTDQFLFPPTISEIKSASSYRFQSSITAATVKNRAAKQIG